MQLCLTSYTLESQKEIVRFQMCDPSFESAAQAICASCLENNNYCFLCDVAQSTVGACTSYFSGLAHAVFKFQMKQRHELDFTFHTYYNN